MSKYPKTLGRIEAVWNKLGGEEGVDRFLRGELTVSETPRKWRERGGIIYLSVTSDGTTGPDWRDRFNRSGYHLGEFTRSMFFSHLFNSSNGVTVQIAILKGLDQGAEVVSSGQVKLKNGARVVVNNTVVPSDNPNPKVQEH
jgi:hypothetical protein